MSAPYIHALTSAKKWKGVPEDYIDIHELMDSTKACFPDNRHRTITHNTWFTQNIIPKVFGHRRVNSAGYSYNTKDVAELHILEDFRMLFIPTVQDYLENMKYLAWMNNAFGKSQPRSKLVKADEQTNINLKIYLDDGKE